MFRWNIAKYAEAVLSQWAMKRLCKFLLKKKLGQFILGEIDLDQVDVQLRGGTIQLCDLALNVEYINDKLSAAGPVVLKEGSISSLLVKMPWKDRGFEIEVDELELVLAPTLKNNNKVVGDKGGSFGQGTSHQVQGGLEKNGHGLRDNGAKSSFLDVHEGVKAIAKMVKWLLTQFHVKVKKLVVAFEAHSEKDNKKIGSLKALVLRVSEIECGTCVSEDDNSYSDPRMESFLGISRLTNFVKFEGAVLELLPMEYIDNQTGIPCSSDSGLGASFSGYHPSNAAIPVVTGQKGGFSGNLRLSIPWKNGSLDIRKVDAVLSVDPVELRFQPSTIKWFFLSWETYKNLDKDGRSNMHCKSSDSIYLNSASHFNSSTLIPVVLGADKVVPLDDSSSFALSYLSGHESVSEAILHGSHLIPDWMPNSVKENTQGGTLEEIDLGASVDQFFECFDGMRNSQSALGSSGMWNWTCSVFSALTAASSLASGSLHIPSEQQHVQTNLKANLAGISITLSFEDEGQDHLYDLKGDQSSIGSNGHCLDAKCRDIYVVLQVRPQEMRIEGTLKHVEVAYYLCDRSAITRLHSQKCSSDSNCQTCLMQRLQSEVQGALPPLASPVEDLNIDELSHLDSSDLPVGNIVKVKLLSTSGVTSCQCTIHSDTSDGSLMEPTSFSVQLPLFIFWFDFLSVSILLDLLKDVGNYVEMNSEENESPCVLEELQSSNVDAEKGSGSGVGTLLSKESLQVNISVPNARVILCFPFQSGKDTVGYSSWEQFVAIDFSSPSSLDKGKFHDSIPVSNASSRKKYSSRSVCSLHFRLGDLKIYLVNRTCKNDVGINSSGSQGQKFCAQRILSVSSRAGCLSTVSMLWQDAPATGPWMVKRAKFLATSEESRNRKKFMGSDYEFATVTSTKDLEDMNSQAQEEIILSSALILHVNLFSVCIDMSRNQYKTLHHLLGQINGLSGVACDAASVGNKLSVSQMSFLLESKSVEILIRLDLKEDIKCSLQNELPGSWNHLKLNIQKFELLFVSNIGAIMGTNFLHLGHGEGKLWGSVTGVPDQEFLLISCSNSTRKRGNGEGSNVLSSRFAGSEIVHLWDPKCLHGFISIAIRCGTIVAVGGRLDWIDAISSFFCLPCSEVDKAGDNSSPKGDLDAHAGSSFILKLVDVGLSYEPYLKTSVVGKLHTESSSSYLREERGDRYVACLVVASSLTLSCTTMDDSMGTDYKITVEDLGLLICVVHENLGGTYSTECLNEMGYVKVAKGALIEAIMRTSSNNSPLWELECSESHIYVETCHDTTSGLMQLAAQFQQLYAPDLEESVVHLQTRWNNVNQTREGNEFHNESSNSNDDFPLSESQAHGSSTDMMDKLEAVGLMDEISEDAFHLNGSQAFQFDSNESQIHVSVDAKLLGEACSISSETTDVCSHDLSFDGPLPLSGLEGSQTSFVQGGSFPEFLEEHFLCELRPLSELSTGRQLSAETHKCTYGHYGDGNLGMLNGGWYGDASLSIVENHISQAGGEASISQNLEDHLPFIDSARFDDFGKATGRVILKNINLSWKMYTGSDWRMPRKNVEPSTNTCGRDTTVLLEVALYGMKVQYDFFPPGDVSVSKLSLSIQDFFLYDRSKNAPWKLVLGYYHSKDHPRESSSKAFKLDLEAIRPDPLIPLEEYRLQIAFLPMLLHLHQSHLDFLISFFGPKSSLENVLLDPDQNAAGAKSSVTKNNNLAGQAIADEALLPYFQKFDIWPILLRVDYNPHHIDLAALRGGKYVELVNLVPWKGVELNLKHVQAAGVYGWGCVCETIVGEWLDDISQNQIHKVLRGLPTIRSLVAVGSSAAKLVSLPVESYKKDQRVLKGVQRGTIAFLRSISIEAIGLGVHLAAGVHDILLQAEYIISNVPPSVPRHVRIKTMPNVRFNQPKDAKEGIQQAYETLSDGLGKSASALVRMPLKKYQRGASAGSTLTTAVRAVPAAAIAPVSACASAAHSALLGIRNSKCDCSLDPDRKKESMEKYLGPSQP